MFKKLIAFFQRHPGIKTTAAGILGTAVSLAAGGTFGPKAAAVAAGATTIIGVFTRRPQDSGPEHREEEAGKEADKALDSAITKSQDPQ